MPILNCFSGMYKYTSIDVTTNSYYSVNNALIDEDVAARGDKNKSK